MTYIYLVKQNYRMWVRWNIEAFLPFHLFNGYISLLVLNKKVSVAQLFEQIQHETGEKK